MAPGLVLFYVCLKAARSVFVSLVQLKPSLCQRSSHRLLLINWRCVEKNLTDHSARRKTVVKKLKYPEVYDSGDEPVADELADHFTSH